MTQIRTIVVMPAGIACNLACKYCYYDGQVRPPVKTQMSIRTLEALVRQVLEVSAERVVFIWHGGEPMLLNTNFYTAACEFQDEYCSQGQEVCNHVQTNLTIMSPEKVEELLGRRRFKMSTSIDGPPEVHNAYRARPDGSSVLDVILRNVRFIESRGHLIGFLSVVTNRSSGRAKEIYQFLKSVTTNHSWDYLLCFQLHLDRTPSEYMPDPTEASEFLIESFDMWYEEDDPNIHIRLFADIIRGLLGKHPRDCTFNNGCGGFLGIDHQGDVYPCGRFVAANEVCLGNIQDPGGLKGILSSSMYNDLIQEMLAPPSECLSCHYLSICNGGCAFFRYHLSGGDFRSPYYYCEVRKTLFGHIEARLAATLQG